MSTSTEDLLANTNKDDKATSLSDVTLELKADDIKGVCQQWESNVLAIDLSSIDVTSTFAPLTNAGVGTSYIPCLKKALEKADSLVLSASKTIKEATTEQTDTDDRYSNTDNGGNGGNDRNGRNGGNGGNGGGDDDGGDKNKNKNIKVNKDFISKVNSLEDDKYIKFMTLLGTITKGDLLKYLADEDAASDLKKLLLSSPNLDPDLKQLISEMDENELQVTLQAMFTDQNPIADASRNIIYTYTENLAKNSNVDIIKANTIEQFYNNVDNFFNALNSLKDKDDLQKNISDIYDGKVSKNVGTESVEFIRTAVDEIAKSLNMSSDDLLSNASNTDKLKQELTTLTKDLSFFRTVNTMGSDASTLLFKSIIKKEG